MTSHTFQSYKTRFLQIAFGLAVVAVGLYVVRNSMGGSARMLTLMAGLVCSVVTLLVLKDKYWLVLPLLSSLSMTLPGLRFNPEELGCLVVVGTRFVRLALRKERPGTFGRELFPATMMVVWMAFVFLLNPTGMYVFGSSSIGGRFYFQVAISYWTLLSLSQLRLGERDARLLFFSLCTAFLFRVARQTFFGVSGGFSGNAFELSTNYSYIFASSIFILMFARWSIRELCSSPWRMLLVVCAAVFSIYSGKRRIFGTIFLVPVLRSFLTGRQKLLTAFLLAMAFFLLGFVVAADGAFYHLPKSATRSLSVVFPKYQQSGAIGRSDPFRAALREEARRVIRENPWVGRKGFSMSLLDTHLIFAAVSGARFSEADIAVGYGYGGSWHSTWYAYAADFGLPCLALWAWFAFLVLRFSFRACRTVSRGTYLPTCCLYYSMNLFLLMAFSYTTGQSAITTMEWFTTYGMLLALFRGYEREQGAVQS